MKNSKLDTFAVQISFVQSDSKGQEPKPTENIYVEFPLGTPLPHAGDSFWMNGIFYTVKSRALMIDNDVYRNASWNLLVEPS